MIACQTKRLLQVEYSAPVRDCFRELRVFPAPQRAGQTVCNLQWQCSPPPDESEETEDDFGNRVLRLHHHRIAQQFRFEMKLETSHDASTPITRETNLSLNGIGAFLLPSALCNRTPEIEAAARELKGATTEEICDFVFRTLEYSPGATTLKTSASQSLQSKRGVCQDFAHMMIAICRELKIPARYVSGYLPGEGAMHAWCEVLVEENWRGFDPTHNREAREDYVFVASGRDFRDCVTISGSFRGRSNVALTSNCKSCKIPNIA